VRLLFDPPQPFETPRSEPRRRALDCPRLKIDHRSQMGTDWDGKAVVIAM